MRYVWVALLYFTVIAVIFTCVNNALALDCSRIEAASYCSYMEDMRNSNPRNFAVAVESNLDYWEWPNVTMPNRYKADLPTLSFSILKETLEHRKIILNTLHELQEEVEFIYVVPTTRNIWISTRPISDMYAMTSYNSETGSISLVLDESTFFSMSKADRMVVLAHEMVHIRLFAMGFNFDNECGAAYHQVMAYSEELQIGQTLGTSVGMQLSSEAFYKKAYSAYERQCLSE